MLWENLAVYMLSPLGWRDGIVLCLKPMCTGYHVCNAGIRGEYSEMDVRVGPTSSSGSRC